MARTAVPYDNLVPNGNLAQPAGTTADPTNGHIVNTSVPELTVLRVTNTAVAAKNVTVKAGAYPPALAKGLGDLVVSVAATTGVQLIGPLESGRFLQADGSLWVDLEAGTTGTVTALKVPRNT